MKKTIILSENKFSKLFNLLNENTIYLQLINGYFYPTNGVSEDILSNEYHLSRIPEESFDRWSPKFVRDGHKLAINGYNPSPSYDSYQQIGQKIGGEQHSVKNPCDKCKINGLCDSDECGNKIKKYIKYKKG